MCLAIVKPAGLVIPKENLRNGWLGNPDGAGYGFVDPKGKIVIRKGFSKLKEFDEAYDADSKQYTETPFLVHFRIRTQGDKSAENTHPFEIDGGILIHNGNISGTGATYGVGKSDTALFAEKFRSNLSFDFVMKNKKDLDDALTYSKVAILYEDKRFVIINEKDGKWDKDVWYSNNSYCTLPYRGPYGHVYDYED